MRRRLHFSNSLPPERRLEALEARAAIEDVLHRYARACDRADAEMLRTCFWPESTHRHGRFEGLSSAFVDYAMGILAMLKYSAHHVSNAAIEVNGERAFSECHFLAHHRRAATPDLPERDDFYEGRYIDFFERRAGAWKIIRRRGLNDFMSAAAPANVAYDQWPAGQHSARHPLDEYYEMRRTFETPPQSSKSMTTLPMARRSPSAAMASGASVKG